MLAILDNRLFSFGQFPFTTRETELDYYHQRVHQFPHELLADLQATGHLK